jgi:hypothetical protein
VIAAIPNVREMAATNRAFLRHAVWYLLDVCVRRLLDIGSGIPTVGNVHEMVAALSSGSDLAISHGVIDSFARDQYNAVGAVYQHSSRGGGLRDQAGIERFFAGLELVEPGLVWMSQWRGGEQADAGPHPQRSAGLAGAARKP